MEQVVNTKIINSKKVIVVAIVIAFILILACIVYKYRKNEHYEPNVSVTEPIELILYFAPWCGHCKALKPEWEKLKDFIANSKELKGRIVIREVNCDQNECPVQGYPTIMMKKHNTELTYEGDRKVEGFVEFIHKNL
jgi:thiol-disulfide isomerase/thioredoxin